MCNAGFEWVPKTVAETQISEGEKLETTGTKPEETTLLPVMSAFVPLVLLIVAIMAYFVVERKRKAARMAAVRTIFPLKDPIS